MADAAASMEQWQQGPALEVQADPAVEPQSALTARLFEAADYPLAAHWWEQHGWPVVPLTSLPSIGLLIITGEGKPICASFMYRDSGWAYIAWTVGDAEAPRALRSAAVDFAVASLTQLADALGVGLLYTSTRNPAMQDRYTRLGWTPCETDFQTFIRPRPTAKED